MAYNVYTENKKGLAKGFFYSQKPLALHSKGFAEGFSKKTLQAYEVISLYIGTLVHTLPRFSVMFFITCAPSGAASIVITPVCLSVCLSVTVVKVAKSSRGFRGRRHRWGGRIMAHFMHKITFYMIQFCIVCDCCRHVVPDADGRTQENSSLSLSWHDGCSQTDRLVNNCVYLYVLTLSDTRPWRYQHSLAALSSSAEGTTAVV